ncbi:hypothetical protein F5Y07DRAFT_186481 [Xylaria sp. FL0933]|nr:hypothetical protein F5Y07DRAFT_186481 [Xylaria sp. FL0933]
MRYFLVLWLATLLRVVAENPFISPRNSAKGPGKYTTNARWPLGSSQLVAFHISWKEYRIELWQQSLNSGAKESVNLIYGQNGGQDLPQSFFWTVQTYEFLLAESPVFFFTLQDNNNATARENSPFFNITIATVPPNPPNPVSSLRPETAESSTAPTTSSISTTSTISTATSYTASSPAGHALPTQGLSAGAAAGIGIGVSLSVVFLVSILGVLFLRRRHQSQQQQQPAELPSCEIRGCETGKSKRDTLITKIITKFDQPRVELPG